MQWRYRKKFASHQKFYDAAAAGTLPSFSWISPSEQGSDHPCNDIRKGERQLKDIYQAIRAGPKWNKTLVLVVYVTPQPPPSPWPLNHPVTVFLSKCI